MNEQPGPDGTIGKTIELFGLAPFHQHLGAVLTAGAGAVHVDVVLDERFESIPGRVHGGIVATLLDTTATWALIVSTGEVWTTVDVRIDYLRPTPTGALRTTGTVVTTGRSLGRATAVLSGDDGRVTAVANGTFTRAG